MQVFARAEEYDFSHWLPLALADIAALLCAKETTRETWLDTWGLHRMAGTIRDARTDSALEDFFGLGRGRE